MQTAVGHVDHAGMRVNRQTERVEEMEGAELRRRVHAQAGVRRVAEQHVVLDVDHGDAATRSGFAAGGRVLHQESPVGHVQALADRVQRDAGLSRAGQANRGDQVVQFRIVRVQTHHGQHVGMMERREQVGGVGHV